MLRRAVRMAGLVGVARIAVFKDVNRQQTVAVLTTGIVPQERSAAEIRIVLCLGVSAAKVAHHVTQVSETYRAQVIKLSHGQVSIAWS